MSKEESVSAAMGKFEEAVGAVYEAGFEAGKLEVPAAPPVEVPPPVAVDPNDQAALEAALKPLQDEILDLKAQLAAPDLTPHSDEDLEKAKAEAVEKAVGELKAAHEAAGEAEDEKQEAISAAMKELAEKISALHVKAAPVVEDGSVPSAEV